MDKGYYKTRKRKSVMKIFMSQSTIKMDKGYYVEFRAGAKHNTSGRNPQ